MSDILVVDDDRSTNHLACALLKSQGYRVISASDGLEALDLTRDHRFDLIIVDVWMPRMTGLDLLAELRRRPEMPKVIVMTADDTPETLLQAVKEQAYRFMHKPVDADALTKLVREVLESKPASRPIEVLSARPDWVEILVPCEVQSVERIHALLSGLATDLSQGVRESVETAFRELLMNAIEWGGELDPSRSVRIAYLRAKRMLLYRIADPGKGFRFEGLTHSAVTNPSATSFEHLQVREEKGLRPGGFGLLMTRAVVDELIYNEAQNEVVFVKYLD